MSEPCKAIALDELARLHPIDGLSELVGSDDTEILAVDGTLPFDGGPNPYLAGDMNLHFRGLYQYADALAIEVARQLHHENGLPLRESLRMASYTSAVREFFASSLDEFWVAIVTARNDTSDRVSSVGFGPNEFWSSMHFAGNFMQVAESINVWMHTDAQNYGAMPSRIFLANVSTADRRLRKRAASLGIAIVGNEFAADAT